MEEFGRQHSKDGFALVLALSLMSFIVLLVLSLSALVQVEIQQSRTELDRLQARCNALLGMQIAIGKLQSSAGPDTRVTAKADVLGLDPANPARHWTGVWSSADANPAQANEDVTLRAAYQLQENRLPEAWLVSIPGVEPGDIDPATTVIEPTSRVELMAASEDYPAVVAGRVTLSGAQEQRSGSYAWWIGDEGVKARLNTDRSLAVQAFRDEDILSGQWLTPNTFNKSEIIRAGLAVEAGHQLGDSLWEKLSLITPAKALRLPDIWNYGGLELILPDMSAEEQASLKELRHDFTMTSWGLVTNPSQGGLKRDLSIGLADEDMFKHWFGASPTSLNASNPQRRYLTSASYTFTNIDEDFFISPQMHADFGDRNVGPNWGILWNYYNLHRLYRDQGFLPGEAPPQIQVPEARVYTNDSDWAPYSEYITDVGGARYEDAQQHNQVLTPLIERIMIIMRIRSVETVTQGGRGGGTRTTYRLQVGLKPVVTLWNPYDVKLTVLDPASLLRQYHIKWEAFPTVDIKIGNRPDGGDTIAQGTLDFKEFFRGPGVNHIQLGVPKDTDFEPGEVRLFTLGTDIEISQSQTASGGLGKGDTVPLINTWSTDGFVYAEWPTDGSEIVPSGKSVILDNVRLEGLETNPSVSRAGNYALLDVYIGPSSPPQINGLQRMTSLWNNDSDAGDFGSNDVPPYALADITGDNWEVVGAWQFNLRTTNEGGTNAGLRNFIDCNPRALVSNPVWDGSSSGNGWFATSHYSAAGKQGLLTGGDIFPQTGGDFSRFQGLTGASLDIGGVSHVPVFSIPRTPLLSVGQLQHAMLGRYNFEPAFVVGNSYAPIRVPLGEVVAKDFNSLSGFHVHDISYLVNDQLWDNYFFSTIDPLMSQQDFERLLAGDATLPNPRYKISPIGGANTTVKSFVDSSTPEILEASAGSYFVEGAFNVNSTSPAAWRALLGSLSDPRKLPLLERVSGTVDEQDTEQDTCFFSRLNYPIDGGYVSNSSSAETYFGGYRSLTDTEISELADAMVEQVRTRGPFLSLADFVNRRIQGDPEQQQKGALQAALDATVNREVNGTLTSGVQVPEGPFSQVFDANSVQASGYPGYLLQGDVLQALAPFLSVRSDTFTIRSYGDSVDPITGDAVSRIWCEAVVQRMSGMTGTGTSDAQEMTAPEQELQNTLNRRFGREFKVIQFRFLNGDEV